jgi:SHS2 domain-containing protein
MTRPHARAVAWGLIHDRAASLEDDTPETVALLTDEDQRKVMHEVRDILKAITTTSMTVSAYLKKKGAAAC